MTSLSETIELIEKAMGAVTPGPWQTSQTRTDIQRFTVVGPSEVVAGMDGICEPDRMNDRSFAEDAANMRYIAACNPVAMSALLAEARKAEAMEQEIAELREAAKFAIAALETLQGYEADLGDELLDDYEIGRIEDSRHSPSFRIRVGHIRRLARTLLNGGSDAQG